MRSRARPARPRDPRAGLADFPVPQPRALPGAPGTALLRLPGAPSIGSLPQPARRPELTQRFEELVEILAAPHLPGAGEVRHGGAGGGDAMLLALRLGHRVSGADRGGGGERGSHPPAPGPSPGSSARRQAAVPPPSLPSVRPCSPPSTHPSLPAPRSSWGRPAATCPTAALGTEDSMTEPRGSRGKKERNTSERSLRAHGAPLPASLGRGAEAHDHTLRPSCPGTARTPVPASEPGVSTSPAPLTQTTPTKGVPGDTALPRAGGCDEEAAAAPIRARPFEQGEGQRHVQSLRTSVVTAPSIARLQVEDRVGRAARRSTCIPRSRARCSHSDS